MVCDDHLRDRRHDGHSRQFYGERRISGYYGGFRNRARSGATPIHRLLWCHDRRHAAFGLGDPEFRTTRRLYRRIAAFPLRLGDERSRHEYHFAFVRSRLPRDRCGRRSTTGDGGDIFGLARAVQRHVDGALQHGHGIGANYGSNAWRSRARVFQLALRLPTADPTAGIALVMGILFMPSKELPKKLPKFDFIGLLLMWTALASLLLSFSFGQRLGWVSDIIIIGFISGVVTSVAFVLRQIYGPHPLVNMKLFLVPRFSAAAVISFFAGCAFLSSTFMIPLFVQEIQHYTPLRAGLLMIPGGLSLLVLFPLSGRLTDMLPTSYLIYFGLFAFGMAFVFMSQADVNTPFWTFVSFTILIRIGTAFIRPVMNTEALRALPQDLVNQGSGVVNFIRMLGAAIGTNVLVVFLELRIPFHLDAFTATQVAASRASGELLDPDHAPLVRSRRRGSDSESGCAPLPRRCDLGASRHARISGCVLGPRHIRILRLYSGDLPISGATQEIAASRRKPRRIRLTQKPASHLRRSSERLC